MVSESRSDLANGPRQENGIYGLLNFFSTRRALTVLIVLEIVVVGLIVVSVTRVSNVSGGLGILDAEFGYTYQQVIETFDAYGQSGLDAFRTVQLLDLLHPAIYSLLLASLLYLPLGGSRWRWLSLTPLVSGALDYIENALIWIMTETYPEVSSVVVSVSSVVSVVKYLSFVLVFVAVGVAIKTWLDTRRAVS